MGGPYPALTPGVGKPDKRDKNKIVGAVHAEPYYQIIPLPGPIYFMAVCILNSLPIYL